MKSRKTPARFLAILAGMAASVSCTSAGPLNPEHVARPAEDNHVPQIQAELRLLENVAGAVAIMVSITSSTNEPFNIDLVSAGGTRLELPKGFSDADPGASYFAGASNNRRVRRHISLRPGQTFSFQVPVSVTETIGSVAVGLEPDRSGIDGGDGSILHLVRTGNEVLSSSTSALDLEAQLLGRQKAAEEGMELGRVDEEDPSVQALFRGGATTRAIQAEEKDYNQNVTLEAQVEITARAPRPQPNADYGNVIVPARFIEVEFFDQDGSTLTSLGKASTDATGLASVQVPATEEDGSAQDVVLRAYASGPYARIVRDTQATPVQTVESQVQPEMQRGGRIVLTTDRAQSNNRAFEVHEAIDRQARYLVGLSPGNRPKQVTVRYPRVVNSPNTGSSYLGGTIWLLDQDGHDWDNIQHEYGHHLGSELKIGRNPGGGHSGFDNLCRRLTRGRPNGKATGVNLAFSESWPTVMAVMNQREQNQAALGLAFVGDTRFTNTNAAGDPGLNYDLENTGGNTPRVTEGVEYSIMETIWDVYDQPNENTDSVTIAAADIWRALLEGGRQPFHGFWNALHSTRSYDERNRLGRIMGWRRISGVPSAPVSGTTYRGGPLTLEWQGAEGCFGNAGLRYQVVVTDEATGRERWRSTFDGPTSRALTDQDRATVFSGPRGERLRWTIVTRDTETPQTGDYSGGSAVIVDDMP